MPAVKTDFILRTRPIHRRGASSGCNPDVPVPACCRRSPRPAGAPAMRQSAFLAAALLGVLSVYQPAIAQHESAPGASSAAQPPRQTSSGGVTILRGSVAPHAFPLPPIPIPPMKGPAMGHQRLRRWARGGIPAASTAISIGAAPTPPSSPFDSPGADDYAGAYRTTATGGSRASSAIQESPASFEVQSPPVVEPKASCSPVSSTDSACRQTRS